MQEDLEKGLRDVVSSMVQRRTCLRFSLTLCHKGWEQLGPLARSFINVKSFFVFCAQAVTLDKAKQKLVVIGGNVSDQHWERFHVQLDCLLAWVWGHRLFDGVHLQAPAASGAASVALPAPPVAHSVVNTFGAYSPTNTNTNSFSPSITINVPSSDYNLNKTANTARRLSVPKTGIGVPLQHRISAFYPKEGKDTPLPIDLKSADPLDVLKHFNLKPLERDNQRSDFMNTFIADEARGFGCDIILGEQWFAAAKKRAEAAFEKAKGSGEIVLKSRGSKKKSKKREMEKLSNAIANIKTKQSKVAGPREDEDDKVRESPGESMRGNPAAPRPSSNSSKRLREEDGGADELRLYEEEDRGAWKQIESDKAQKKQSSGEVQDAESSESGKTLRAGENVNLEVCTKRVLKGFCSANGLAVSGSKQTLVARLNALFTMGMPRKDKVEEEEEELQPVEPGSGKTQSVGSNAPVGEGKTLVAKDTAGEGKTLVAKDTTGAKRGVAESASKAAVEVVGSAEGVERGDRVIVNWENKLYVVFVSSVPDEDDESGLFECKFSSGKRDNVFVTEEFLLQFPKKPEREFYKANHFVLYTDPKSSELLVAQLAKDVRLSFGADGLHIFKSTMEGKSNFVPLVDSDTQHGFNLRPADVVFDVFTDGSNILETDFVVTGFTFLGVHFAFEVSDSSS